MAFMWGTNTEIYLTILSMLRLSFSRRVPNVALRQALLLGCITALRQANLCWLKENLKDFTNFNILDYSIPFYLKKRKPEGENTCLSSNINCRVESINTIVSDMLRKNRMNNRSALSKRWKQASRKIPEKEPKQNTSYTNRQTRLLTSGYCWCQQQGLVLCVLEFHLDFHKWWLHK